MNPRYSIAAAVLLLGGAAVVWRIKTSASKPSAAGSVSGVVPALAVQIRKTSIRKSGDHAQLSLTALFTQSGQAPLRLDPPIVILLTAQQVPVPRFLGPLLPDPVLPGTMPTEVTLHFWLPVSDLMGPMTLEAGGQRYPVPPPEVGLGTP